MAQALSDDLAKFLLQIQELDVTKTEEFVGELKFEGFDATKVLESVMNVKKAIGDAKFINDLTYMVSFFIVRGASLADRVMNKLKPDAKSKLLEIKGRWGLVITKPQKTTELTIARIMSVVPGLVARVIHKNETVARLTGRDKLDETTKASLPPQLCFPQAASIIPNDCPKMWAAFLVWNEKFSETVVNKEGTKSAQKPEWFATQARTNSIVKDDMLKKKLLVAAGIDQKLFV